MPNEAMMVVDAARAGTVARQDTVWGSLFPLSPVRGLDRLTETIGECREKNLVLLVDHPRLLPVESWYPLAAYVEQGGALLLVGPHPFAAAVSGVGADRRTREEHLADIMKSAVADESFSRVRVWPHENDQGIPKGRLRTADAQELPWPAIYVETGDLNRWDAICSGTISNGLGDCAALAFYARGTPHTTRLVIEASTAEERWVSSVPLTEAWQPIVLPFTTFVQRNDFGLPPPAESTLDPRRVRGMRIGIFTDVETQSPRAEGFGISDVRLLDDVDPAARNALPSIFAPLEPSRRYAAAGDILQNQETGSRIHLHGTTCDSASQPLPPRADGIHRWIPVFSLLDESEATTGWPASIYLSGRPDGTTRAWGWIGLNAGSPGFSRLKAVVAQTAARLHDSRFLLQAGTSGYSCSPGEPLAVTAVADARDSDIARLRVAAELLDSGGRVLRRVVSDPLQRAAEGRPARVELYLGTAPSTRSHMEVFHVRTVLEDVTGRGTAYDSIQQPLAVLRPAGPVPVEDWLATTGSRFTFHKRPVFLFGVEYSPGDPGTCHWLDADVFSPARLQLDLTRLEQLGVNALRVSVNDPAQAPQFRYFLEEVARHNQWVLLSIPGLDPLSPDWERAAELIEALKLPYRHRVFALDASPGPRLGAYAERARWDDAWTAWLTEQFGSIEHARECLADSLWFKDGYPTSPPDEALSVDGDHRTGVACYRRFTEDLISRRLGAVKRFLHQKGCRQLICADQGGLLMGDPGAEFEMPIDPAGLALHLDFLCLPAAGLQGPAARFHEAAFWAAYARGVSDRKPVVWMGFASSVGSAPSAVDLEWQADQVGRILDLGIRSYSSGCFLRADRVDHTARRFEDHQLLEVDGSPRPAGRVVLEFANRLRREKQLPRVWSGREMLRYEQANGLSALWNRWRNTYRQETAAEEMTEIRPAGFSKLTTEVSFHLPGGESCRNPAPFESVNAEWGALLVNGKSVDRTPGEAVDVNLRDRITLEIFNSGPATWAFTEEGRIASVGIRCSHPVRRDSMIKTRTLAFGRNEIIHWIASDPGPWQLRAHLEGIGSFGEALAVHVSSRGGNATGREDAAPALPLRASTP